MVMRGEEMVTRQDQKDQDRDNEQLAASRTRSAFGWVQASWGVSREGPGTVW